MSAGRKESSGYVSHTERTEQDFARGFDLRWLRRFTATSDPVKEYSVRTRPLFTMRDDDSKEKASRLNVPIVSGR
jgi:hypothetical protein